MIADLTSTYGIDLQAFEKLYTDLENFYNDLVPDDWEDYGFWYFNCYSEDE